MSILPEPGAVMRSDSATRRNALESMWFSHTRYNGLGHVVGRHYLEADVLWDQ